MCAEQIGGVLLTVCLCVLIPALSFYMPDGYRELGNAKFAAYRLISLAFGAPLLVCAGVLSGKRLRAKRQGRGGAAARRAEKWLLPADVAVFFYALFLAVSFLLSFDRSESLWGTTGWRMGFLTELLFLAFYLFARLFPVQWRVVAVVGGGSAAAVLLIGVLDRRGFHFLPFMGVDESFLSTIGNVDWYCGYLALALSLAAGLWLSALRASALVLLLLGILSTITQGADAGLLLLIALVLAAMAFGGFRGQTGGGARIGRRICRAALVLFLGGLFFLPLLWSAPVSDGLSVLLGGDGFGNGRGAIWRISWAIWRELPPLRKLFGVGPDAYAAYTYASPAGNRLVIAAFGAARLTNAHSEWVTVLLNEGIAALAAWLAFCVLTLRELARRAERTGSALTLCAIFAMVTIVAVQAVTFRTVTATPFLFLLAGAALRGTKNER